MLEAHVWGSRFESAFLDRFEVVMRFPRINISFLVRILVTCVHHDFQRFLVDFWGIRIEMPVWFRVMDFDLVF